MSKRLTMRLYETVNLSKTETQASGVCDTYERLLAPANMGVLADLVEFADWRVGRAQATRLSQK